jgi:aspartyl-tRNA(Asn)/glutamyl-tRNA(Gln) amidotransferase subunit A
MIADEYSSIFARGVHVLLTPTSATAAKTFDELKMQSGVDGYLDDIMTVPANLAGLPAISVPVGRVSASSFQWRSGSRGLPLGLQLIGRSFDESTLLRTAAALELRAKFESLPFHTQY